jgi:ribosomal protein L11 methyltransferase
VPESEVSSYREVSLEVPRRSAELICDFITTEIAQGLILEESEDSAVTGIRFYLPEPAPDDYRDRLNEYIAAVLEVPKTDLPRISEKSIQDLQWVEAYKKSVRPLVIAGDVVVRPPWAEAIPGVGYDIVIEPKMAFGTGSHETTRSCLKVIRERFRPGMKFLDFGCGSGVLSVLASRMGAGSILAVDHDVTAVDNCRENFVINEVADGRVAFGSLEKCTGEGPYDFVCVNIIRSVILPLLERLLGLVAPDGILVLSGLLRDDEEEVSACLRQLDCEDWSTLPDSEWLTYVIEKRP